jgi:hypothetical protein
VAVLLIGLIKLLMTPAGDQSAEDDQGAGGRVSGGRKPFPKKAPFSDIPSPGQVEPKTKSAPKPWQDERKRE